eukprot:5145167-Pyramimonas_sp.AAC.1
MRHFRLLCNESLEVLSHIFGIIEMMSTLPIQIRLVMLAMLPKPMGGLRPIGTFTSTYRLWGKTRREVAVEWEEAHSA